MNLQQAKKIIRFIQRIANMVGLIITAAVVSPAVLVALCATRGMTRPAINFYGISYIALCIAFALILLIVVIYKCMKVKVEYGKCLKLNKQGYDLLCETIKTRGLALLRGFIVAIVEILLLIIPFYNLCTLETANRKFVVLNIGLFFLIVGAFFGIIISSLIRFFSIKRVKYELDSSLPEDDEGEERKRKKLQKVMVIASCVVLVFVCLLGVLNSETWYIQPYISTIPTVPHRNHTIKYDDHTGVYTIVTKKNEKFKILQLTDIHLGGSMFSYNKDIKALQAVYDLVSETQPDLIIVTGDFVFPLAIQSFSLNNYTPFLQFATFMRNMGIPWAFVYGNHDTEMVASHSAGDLDKMLSKFTYERTGTLLYSEIQPKITGRSNQVILMENEKGKTIQALYLLDSNSYVGNKINDYDCIHDDQVEWYRQSVESLAEKQGSVVPSMIFTHIPLQEYQTAYELYKSGSDQVKYYYGGIGEENEAICCSQYPSKLFDTAVELGSTKAIFCGHDHYNNISMEYRGIRLTYGMSIDYLAMPGIDKLTKQRGATKIVVKQDSTFEVKPIPLDDVRKHKKKTLVFAQGLD